MTGKRGSAISVNGSQNAHSSAKSFEEKFKRIMLACGASNDSELARTLNITSPSVGTAKKRKKIPSGWVENISEVFGVSADWLFFGTGSMRQDEKKQIHPDMTAQDVDISLLGTILEVVEEVLEDSGKELVPAKKAQLVVAIYDLYKDSEKSVDKSSVLRLVRSVA